MQAAYEEECILCCRDIKIYATGTCDHPVCYECSARMRVLCETNECPVCRSNMPVVVFSHLLRTFSSVSKKFCLRNRKYQILFEDESIAEAFDKLLENRCKHCENVFPTFDKLKEHVRRTHELHYCELCSENLKIFTFERKSYSRKDLARHKRHGDPDEKSHRGHPLCEFCDQRYVDGDELFRHLRKDHYFCHFCDADGMYQYYGDYQYLRSHFRKDHYLCEEDGCINETFTSAFRNEVDLKAHIAISHSKNKSKAEVKQARMLDFEFALTPHSRPTGSSSPRGGRYAQNRRRNVEENPSQNRNKPAQQPEPENLDTQSVQEFPYLSEDSASRISRPDNSADGMLNSLTSQSYNRNPTTNQPYAARRNVMSAEEFPALGSTTALASSEVVANQNRKITTQLNRVPARTTNVSAHSNQNPVPTLNFNTNSDEKKSKKMELEGVDRAMQQKSKWTTKKSDFNFEEEFPSLEVKKNPPPFATVSVPKAPSAMVNSSSARRSPELVVPKVTEPTLSDQYVVIKTKSKKKKNRIYTPTDDIPEESSNNKINVIENDMENKDSRKRYMLQSTASTRPGNARFNDTWNEAVSFGNEDFPPLAPSEPAKKPPGLSVPKSRAPPPGFSANSAITNSTVGNKTLGDAIREIVMPNGVKKSTNRDTVEVYKEPQNFQLRNDDLIKRIYDLTNTQAILFNEFKVVSGKFRRDHISAGEYHAKCLDILGAKGVVEIFPELVSLLPDIKKQQELLTVHNTFLSQMNGGAISKKAAKSCSSLVSCERCNQVLSFSDCRNHELLHNREDCQ